MVRNDIIYEIKEATEWCAPIVVTTRANGKIRLCTDYTELNKYVIRERLQLPTVEETLGKLSGAQVFSKLDCSSGFWQLELSPRTRLYTTFITPFGRFAYKRLPFGITSAPEIFQREIMARVGHMAGVTIHVDVMVVTGRNQEEHDKNLENLLRTLDSSGVKLNVEKCSFNMKEIKYVGHIIGKDGIKADPSTIKAIVDYPVPKSCNEVRRFLGMVNYLTRFVQEMSDKTRILRDLLKKNATFLWTGEHEKCFEDIKKTLIKTPVLTPYNPKYLTRVSADSSSYGIGGVMEQKQPDGTWKPNIYVSTALTETERRYAQIEKEAVAILKTVERLQQFLVGLHFEIHTDHKPLVPLLKTKPINELTPRLQRIRIRLLRYSFDITYIPGKELIAADSLSRAPLLWGHEDEDVLHQEIKIFSISTTKEEENSEKMQSSSTTMQLLKRYILEGWPRDIKQVEPKVKPFVKHQAELSIQKGVILYKDRIVIPQAGRSDCLQEIHRGHQGMGKCKRRAKLWVWWPTINQDIERTVGSCEECLKLQKECCEPFLHLEVPYIPWYMVGADVCEYKNRLYLVVQDYYSKYIELARLKSTTTAEMVEKLQEIFARFGIPSVLRTNNASYFSAYKFKTFLKEWKIEHRTSSPKYLASNGLAESAVKVVKSILKKEQEVQLGLLTYRNTPTIYGATPAQLLMGRLLRDTLPIRAVKLKPKLPNHDDIRKRMKEEREKQAERHNKRHRARELQPLETEKRVWIKDLNREGVVLRQDGHPRSYEVESGQGVVRRNRKFLVRLPDRNPPAVSPEVPERLPDSDRHLSRENSDVPVALPNRHSPRPNCYDISGTPDADQPAQNETKNKRCSSREKAL